MEDPRPEFSSSNHQPKMAAASSEPSLTDSRENNENESIQEQRIPMFQNAKMTGTKHLVSSTISAEAAAPRKKILVERNENSNSSDEHSHKTSNFVSKGSPKISSPSAISSPVMIPYNNDNDGAVDGNTVADSYLIAYNPSTYYLSPRPKFLQFNPNRSEISNFQEKEDTQNLSGSCNVDKDEEPQDVKDTSLSPGKESTEKQEIKEDSENGVEKIEDEGDEEEEEFEERRWCLRGVLELMLILLVYSLSISYICSMNSPTPSTNQERVIGSLKNNYPMIQNFTVETSSMKLYDTDFLAVGMEDSDADKVEIDGGGILLIGRLAKEEMVQNSEVIFEDRNVDNVTDAGAETKDERASKHESKFKKEEMVLNSDVIFEDRNEDNVTDAGAETKDESASKHESKFKKFEQSISTKAAKDEDADDCEMEYEVDDSNEENFDEIDGALETEVVGIEVDSETEILEQVLGPGTHENEDSVGYDLEKKECAFNLPPDIEISAKSNMKEFEDVKSSHFVHEVDEIEHDEVETERKGLNTSTTVGVSLASIILGSLAFIFVQTKQEPHSPKKREPRECPAEETVATVFPAMEEKVEFFARPSLSLSMDKASKELSFQIHAPKVELIGELVLGEVKGSSSGYSRKNQMIQSAENMNYLIQPALTSNRPSVREISTTNSNSYGSFAGENKITNEGSKTAEEAKVKVTPVRRSNRIRNRAVSMNLEISQI